METCASVRECRTTGKSHDVPDNPLANIPQRIVLPDHAVDVWRMPLEVAPLQLKQCSSLLSNEEQARVGRFQFERDRRRYVVARGMLRVLLGNYLGVTPETIVFSEGPYGKPCVTTPAMPVHFNLSHSADCAIYAISRTCVPGVDIEYLARDIDYEGLAQRFFSAREHAELQRIPVVDRKRAFLICWTRKEAVAKATGQGLRLPLNRIEVTVSPVVPPQLLNVPGSEAGNWTLYSIDAGRDYVATLALRRAP